MLNCSTDFNKIRIEDTLVLKKGHWLFFIAITDIQVGKSYYITKWHNSHDRTRLCSPDCDLLREPNIYFDVFEE